MKKKSNPTALTFLLILTLFSMVRCTDQTGKSETEGPQTDELKTPLVAKRYYSGFDKAHDTYNAISAASDGKIYYVLSSALLEEGGKMYVYDPETDKTEFLADLTEICGEKEAKAIPQGKSHVRFYEKDGTLYFSSHV